MAAVLKRQQNLYLVPFPFSDLSGSKVRPVVIVSNDTFNTTGEDVIVCAVTTKPSRQLTTVKIGNNSLEQGTLRHACFVKVESIFKIDKRLLLKPIGRIKRQAFILIIKKLRALFT